MIRSSMVQGGWHLVRTLLAAGAIAGYLIWDEVPDRWVIAGAIVIVASGLFVVYREVGGATSIRYLRTITASGSPTLVRKLRPMRYKDRD